MSLTLIGAVVLAIGLVLLLAASTFAMLAFALVCSLFNGSAALVVTGLGNVSVPPVVVGAGFLLVRCLLPARHGRGLLSASLADNAWLALFAGYSVAGAFILPFLFAGTIDLVPLRPSNNPLGLIAQPLRFSPQNITTAGYMAGTLIAALCAHVAVRRSDAALRLARLGSVLGLVHAAIGWAALAAKGTALQAVVSLFRNGIYMQLDQSFAGFARISGISPEPSLYSSYGLIWFVFTTELWLRDLDRRWSGAAALALLFTLIASTSTTAYVGLFAYGAVLLVRQFLVISTISVAKGLTIVACLALLLAGALGLAAGTDEVVRAMGRVLRLTTAEKLESSSGVARFLWARQGLDAFLHSWGLGVGAGSFRSSSIVTAILGGSGAIGLAALLLYLARIFRPVTGASRLPAGTAGAAVSAAAAWTVGLMLIPASVSAPSPDPGLVWGLLAGAALGLRRLPAQYWLGWHRQTTSVPVALAHAARLRPHYEAPVGSTQAGAA